MRRRLIIVVGPTASGKTTEAIRLARERGTEIVSCDSRQFYSELRIGVARPTDEELSAARHHFIACRSVCQPYNVSEYEQDALQVVRRLFEEGKEEVVAVGGSGLYIEALRKGVSAMPDPTPELRERLRQMPIEEKRAKLKMVDPEYSRTVDPANGVRLQRALEVYFMTGKPYSQVLAENRPEEREFDVEIHPVRREPQELRQRIEKRVDCMMEEGLLEEVVSLRPFRSLRTLQTVGYQELFPVTDGVADLSKAVEQIKLNTWHYARKQINWMKRYT